MTIAEEIADRVKYLPIEVQKRIVALLDNLQEYERTHDPDGLIAWTKFATQSAIECWPKEDWSEAYAAWEAKQKKPNEAR